MNSNEHYFKVVCDECGYEFFTPDDCVDYCPHCGNKSVKVQYPLITNETMYRIIAEEDD